MTRYDAAPEPAERADYLTAIMRGVAHDLNNLLSPIIGYPELLSDLFDSQSQEYEDLMEIRNLAVRAVHLVKDVQTILRDEYAETESVHLNRFVRDCLKERTHRELLKTRNVEVAFEEDPSDPAAAASSKKLAKVLECFIALAVIRDVAVRRLPIRCVHAGEGDASLSGFSVDLLDATIDEERAARLCEPFYPLKALSWGRTGLELPGSRELLTRMGGRLEIDAGDEAVTLTAWLPAPPGDEASPR